MLPNRGSVPTFKRQIPYIVDDFTFVQYLRLTEFFVCGSPELLIIEYFYHDKPEIDIT